MRHTGSGIIKLSPKLWVQQCSTCGAVRRITIHAQHPLPWMVRKDRQPYCRGLQTSRADLVQAKELLAISERVIDRHEQTIMALQSQVAALLAAAKTARAMLESVDRAQHSGDMSDFRGCAWCGLKTGHLPTCYLAQDIEQLRAAIVQAVDTPGSA